MDQTWDITDRFQAINEVIARAHHDQIPIGLGFKLRHNPSACSRCRANIAALELAAYIRVLETSEEMEGVISGDD